MMSASEIEEYERLRHSHQGDSGWNRWQVLARKARAAGMVGIPPRLLGSHILPCGFNMREHSFGTRLRHYQKCPDAYCKWRSDVARSIAQSQKGNA